MKHLYFIFSFLLAVGMIGCKDDDEPGTNKKRFNRNAMISVRGLEKNHLKSSQEGVMSYEDSIKMIVRWGWEWRALEDMGDRLDKAQIQIGYTRDTINQKIKWWGDYIISWTVKESEKGIGLDTIYYLGPFVTQMTNYVITAPMRENGMPYQWDADAPDYDNTVRDNIPFDTIAYIPNAVVLKARELLAEAFNRGDYDRVYELFDSAYVFIPITGERYRELEAKGEN